MKKSDILFIIAVAVLLTPFFVSDAVFEAYKNANATHPYVMAFVKFMLLSSVGEMLGLRIKEGVYTYKGYGMLPRAVVWGIFGVLIAIAMSVFKTGIPVVLESMGVENMATAMRGTLSWENAASLLP